MHKFRDGLSLSLSQNGSHFASIILLEYKSERVHLTRQFKEQERIKEL